MEPIELIPARVFRSVALIACSVIALAVAGILYTNPVPAFLSAGHEIPERATSSYRVSAIDFIDPATGWIVVDFDSGEYSILHTDDDGATWTRQLSGIDGGRTHYLKFFDVAVGVLGLVGTTPQLYRTHDGGRTWSSLPVPNTAGSVLSWSFVDSYFGWALITGTTAAWPLPAYLYRTEDGGLTWKNLGVPAPAPDQVFEVSFTYMTTGWLSSANGGPYAYRTSDFGDTWTRVPLPPPAGGWPSGGAFMVAVQPTSDGGVAATVVFFPTLTGRKGQGAKIHDFPPLTVRAFDGGRPVTYVYATPIGAGITVTVGQAEPPNQTELSTLDNGATWAAMTLPSAGGAIGYLDAADWWWVGAGQLAGSRDAGVTWSAPAGIAVHEPLPGSLQVLDRLHAWLISSYRSRPVLQATDDGGRHWRTVSLPSLASMPPAAGPS